jgi:hypothetical protein
MKNEPELHPPLLSERRRQPELALKHWRKNYLRLVAKHPAGATTALNVTLRWAQAEAAYATKHGAKPEVGVPPH